MISSGTRFAANAAELKVRRPAAKAAVAARASLAGCSAEQVTATAFGWQRADGARATTAEPNRVDAEDSMVAKGERAGRSVNAQNTFSLVANGHFTRLEERHKGKPRHTGACSRHHGASRAGRPVCLPVTPPACPAPDNTARPQSETLQLRGQLKGHEGWVTSIATPLDNGDTLLSSSRDKSVILWQLERGENGPNGAYGYPRRALRGHSHFVEDVVISSDGQASRRRPPGSPPLSAATDRLLEPPLERPSVGCLLPARSPRSPQRRA